MTYSVHQHWDPLKVCAVGRSYPPEFYSFITNSRVRSVIERIAEETEQDYQNLIKLLHDLNVRTVRTNFDLPHSEYINNGVYHNPNNIMCPRDHMAMIGDKFYMPPVGLYRYWEDIAGADWGQCPTTLAEYLALDDSIKQEIKEFGLDAEQLITQGDPGFKDIEYQVKQHNEIIYGTGINSAMTARIGRDLFHGSEMEDLDFYEKGTKTCYLNEQTVNQYLSDYRNHRLNTGGHTDATFCAVKPGLIVSLYDVQKYEETFPGWEVVYLPDQSWTSVKPFLDLKEKNKGKWWVPGEELNDDFTNYVEEWFGHWVGYVEETVFDVNMLVVDQNNVICNNENDQVFEAFERHGITPHVCNFRHRYFWDGGIHCVTADIHRQGDQQDYFSSGIR